MPVSALRNFTKLARLPVPSTKISSRDGFSASLRHAAANCVARSSPASVPAILRASLPPASSSTLAVTDVREMSASSSPVSVPSTRAFKTTLKDFKSSPITLAVGLATAVPKITTSACRRAARLMASSSLNSGFISESQSASLPIPIPLCSTTVYPLAFKISAIVASEIASKPPICFPHQYRGESS